LADSRSGLVDFAFTTGVAASAFDVGSLLHRFALNAAILALGYLTRTVWVSALFSSFRCHCFSWYPFFSLKI
jgi:hypothetical protein